MVHCYKADPVYGRGVAKKLEMDMEQFIPWADLTLEELITKTSDEGFKV